MSLTTLIIIAVVLFIVVTAMKFFKNRNALTEPTGVSSLTRMNMSQAMQIGDITCDPQGGVFTGEVWSDDNRTFCIKVANGKNGDMLSFHENGKIAIYHKVVDNNEDHDVYTYYDEFGNVIDENSFNAKYQSVWDRMEQQWPNK